jgi:hypothetical protein
MNYEMKKQSYDMKKQSYLDDVEQLKAFKEKLSCVRFVSERIESDSDRQKKETRKERARAYYLANRERLITKQTEYNKRHAEQIHAYQRSYYQDNKSEFSERDRKYRELHRERLLKFYRDRYYMKKKLKQIEKTCNDGNDGNDGYETCDSGELL